MIAGGGGSIKDDGNQPVLMGLAQTIY